MSKGWDESAARDVLARNAPSQTALPLLGFRGPNPFVYVNGLADPQPETGKQQESAQPRDLGPQTSAQNQKTMQPDAGGWYSLTVVGEPVPKGRPRFRIVTPKGKKPFVTTYTPQETEDYEAMIKAAWVSAGGPFLGGRLQMHVIAFQTPQKNGNPTRQDVDNIAKGVIDSVAHTAFHDDRAIVWLLAEKMEDGHNPRTVIRIRQAPET